MPSPFRLETAKLDWDENNQPISREFGDVYFSNASGLEETQHVFINNNQLPERFSALPQDGTFTIAETGFGTGLNFLCSLREWEKTAPHTAQLTFISVEKSPLTQSDLQKALSLWPELSDYIPTLLEQYPLPLKGIHKLQFMNGRVSLLLMQGDLLDMYQELIATVDAWFLDGFAPAKNPEMWNDSLFTEIAHLSNKNATFSTFTAASAVRRSAQAVNFQVSKVAGFGRKREMLTGVLNDVAPQTLSNKPWFDLTPQKKPETAIVIGGGLAGTATAYKLACKGVKVKLIEKEKAVACGASGNPQGIVYAKLSPHDSPAARISLRCYQYAIPHLQQALKDQPDTLSLCGVYQPAYDEKESKLQRIIKNDNTFSGLATAIDQSETEAVTGYPLAEGLLFSKGGWVNPPSLCEAQSSHENIEVLFNTSVASLEYKNGWHLYDENKILIASSDVVVIANAYAAKQLEQSSFLLIKKIRGQISRIPATADSKRLKTVICTNNYVTPAWQDQHCLGATFNLNDDEPAIREQDHLKNLNNLHERVPELFNQLNLVEKNDLFQQGRVGFRCTSTDYLPIAGPVPVVEDFLLDYAKLSKDSSLPFDKAGSYIPGLYLNIAHGSRGITTTPLCAELVASQICGEALPLEKSLINALNPARFIIKNLIKKES